MDLKALDNMNSNGIITAPINVRADVATVLGVSNTNLSALCSNPNINKWAKYKPIRYATVTKLTEDQRVFRNYGLDINSAVSNSVADVINKVQNNIGWEYLAPRGGGR